MLITVARKGSKNPADALAAKYTLTCDALPGKRFGPHSFLGMRNELIVFVGLSAVEARDVLLNAWMQGVTTYSKS
ncbi:hypothetical protein ABT340_15695 [Streptosporangium sp. NPDC000239]|uniref:hypothetical protein n=1 Tax=Streptosporangium sp. NPDC000239 TaxID=3154248 RepID=UPI003319AF8F